MYAIIEQVIDSANFQNLPPLLVNTIIISKSLTKEFYGNMSIAYSRKSVHFGPKISVAKISRCSSMKESDKKAIWYRASELEKIKEGARRGSKKLRLQRLSSSVILGHERFLTGSDLLDSTFDEEPDFCARGLEFFSCQRRKKKMCYASKIIVAAQSFCNASQLANLSLKLTNQSKILALQTALSDALDTKTSCLIPNSVSISKEGAGSSIKKPLSGVKRKCSKIEAQENLQEWKKIAYR